MGGDDCTVMKCDTATGNCEAVANPVCCSGDADCDDGDPGISPGDLETCDTVDDEDCDGSADEAGAVNCTVYFYENLCPQ